MSHIQNLNTYIKKGAVIIYAATTIMGCIGLIMDIISIHELSKYIVINNLITIGIIIISVLLYLFSLIKMPVSFTVIIYIIILNIIFDFVTKPYGNQQVIFFLRNSFFIIYLITIASLIINKRHGIIISIIYLVSFILMTLISGDKFLKDIILAQLSILLAYAAAIYYFVDAFEKSMQGQAVNNKIILDQNELLNESNSILEERQQKIEELAEELEVQKEELTKINKELNESVATKDKFFSIIAHDLRNPINTLMGFSELLYKNRATYADTKKSTMTKAIYDSSQSVYNLLENLLVWARMQTSGIKANAEKINLHNLIHETTLLLENMCQNKNIELKTSIDITQEIYADKYMLSSVVNNLLSNAIKFTPAGGIIKISSELSGNEMIQVCVSDSGLGITKDNISRLFRIDKSISSSGTNNEKGTGLGLLLCKEFIERNGGKIWVESEPGEGSKFFFTVRKA